MNVLFVNPSRAGQGNIPLNIPLLVSVAKQAGHNVRLFDFSDYDKFNSKTYGNIFFKETGFDVQRILDERRKFYGDVFGAAVKGAELKFSDYHLDFDKLIISFEPDVIAVSSLSTDFVFITDFIEPFKEKYGLTVIFGGVHSIMCPEETINSKVCDFLCTGEGERTLVELLDKIEKKESTDNVGGVWFKVDGRVTRNSPVNLNALETLPMPDFDCFDPIHFYRPFDGKRYKMLNYEFSRGCPYNCTYCVNGVLKKHYRGLGRYHRCKDIEQSIGELHFLIDKYDFDFVRFWDEDFTAVPTHMIEEYALKYREHIGLPFLIYARVESVTERKVEILRDMGCKTFAMGIESGNENIRKQVLNRKMSNQTILDKFGLVRSYGVRTSAYNMLGLPFETRKTIFQTIELNRKVKPDSFSVTLLEPYKGTPIREMCEKQGLDPKHETTFDNTVQFIPKGMTKEEVYGLYRTFPLYVTFPKSRFPKIKEAETDDDIYLDLLVEWRLRDD